MATLSSTLATIRQGTLEHIGEWYSGTTTANGVAGGASVVDTTTLVDFGNDKFNDWWCLITSGTYSGQVRRILDSTQGTGTIVPTSNFGGTIVSGVTYELCKYHPTKQVRWAINKALGLVFPNLHKQVINDDLVAGNWLPNGGFEDWTVSTVPDLWTNSSGASLAPTKASRTGISTDWAWGKASVLLTSTSSGTVTLHCHLGTWPFLADLFGKTIRFEGWTRGGSSNTQLAVYAGVGGTYDYKKESGYNAASSLVQLLRTDELTIPAATSDDTLSFRIEVKGVGTAYWDNVRLMGPECYVYALPLAFQNKPPEQVLIQTGGWAEGNERPCDDRGDTHPYQQFVGWKVEYDTVLGLWLLRLTEAVSPGYRIRLKGMEYIGTLTSDTDTVPLNPPQLTVLYPLAAQLLYESLARNTPDSGQKASYMGMAADCERDYNKARLAHGFARPKSQIDYGNWRY